MKRKENKRVLFRTSIAGVQYGDYQLCLGLRAGLKVSLVWEPSNVYDSNAIRVDYNGVKLGYIPRGTYQAMCHERHNQGYKLFGHLSAVNKNNPTWHMFTLEVQYKPKSNNKRKNEVEL